MWFAHVLEERARQDRQAKLCVEDDEEDSGKAAPDSHFQEHAGIGDDGRRQKYRGGETNEMFTERYVFENKLEGKPSEVLEQWAAGEECSADTAIFGQADAVFPLFLWHFLGRYLPTLLTC